MQLLYKFTDRFGGFSKPPFDSFNLAFHVEDEKRDVELNRKLLCKILGVRDIQFMHQIHSNDVQIISQIQDDMTCDGLITNQKNLALAVMVADCIPLLMCDKKRHVIAALHAGREGVFENIADVALTKMHKHFHTQKEDVVAFLGASIKQCCYEVGGDVLKYAKKHYNSYVKDNRLDIRGILKEQLKGCEVRDFSNCTKCDERYFSYRQERKTGRFVGVIMLKDINA